MRVCAGAYEYQPRIEASALQLLKNWRQEHQGCVTGILGLATDGPINVVGSNAQEGKRRLCAARHKLLRRSLRALAAVLDSLSY